MVSISTNISSSTWKSVSHLWTSWKPPLVWAPWHQPWGPHRGARMGQCPMMIIMTGGVMRMARVMVMMMMMMMMMNEWIVQLYGFHYAWIIYSSAETSISFSHIIEWSLKKTTTEPSQFNHNDVISPRMSVYIAMKNAYCTYSLSYLVTIC